VHLQETADALGAALVELNTELPDCIKPE